MATRGYFVGAVVAAGENDVGRYEIELGSAFRGRKGDAVLTREGCRWHLGARAEGNRPPR